MKQCLILCLALFFTLSGTTQQVFFKSAQAFDKEMLADFYGSITLQGNLLLFNATDFQLYAYDANTGSHKWSYKLNRKSNIPPFPVQNRIWANSKDEVVQLDTATGALVKKLTLTSLLTKPVVKGDIVYATGIYDGGCLYAYDMMSDSVLWKRYLAHGCSVEPYYLSDKIVANREGSDWIEIAYSGRLKVPS
jgi:outer membrane protein assembly factor BamB